MTTEFDGGGVVARAVFINYRGADSHSYGALLYQELRGRFGEDRVFLDCESIPAGADFVDELLSRVRSAPVLLAVIGPSWLTATDSAGCRRIDNPDDWIRRELAEAFTAGVRVIPVLTEQIAIPAEADLPAEIAALSRCQFRRLRHHDSTADLARIATDLTRLDPSLAAAARSRNGAPRQLIGAPRHFVGRLDQLAALDHTLTPDPPTLEDSTPGHSWQAGQDRGATTVIIGGIGGIGKTWLALAWAHRNLHRFPDGQLSVDLRGFSTGEPAHPVDVLADFLAALGVDRDRLPTDLGARAALYRTRTTGKRLLILLDNAATADQIEPLLPGGTTSTVLITSRRDLAGLAALHGARLLDLDVLPEAAARELLARHLDEQRLAAEPQAVAELLAVCAGLPLAVAIVAARAAHHPSFPLAVLAEELRDESIRLDGLDTGDLRANLRAVLSGSLHALDRQAVNMFGLLGIAPGPDISLPAAASLSTGQTRTVLRQLENASLIQQHEPGRYRMHDLIRLYATDTAHHHLSNDVREAALRRLLDFYVHTANSADRLLDSTATSQLGKPVAGCRPLPLADQAAALAWFKSEHLCLLAAQQTAVAEGWHYSAWHLAWALTTFHGRRGHVHDDVAIWRAAIKAADHLPGSTYRLQSLRFLGSALAKVGRRDEGIEFLRQALTTAEKAHKRHEQATIHRALSWTWAKQGDAQRALDHSTRALILYQDMGNRVGEAFALNEVGWDAAQLGQYQRARSHCQAALIWHRRLRNHVGEAYALDSLGYIALCTERHSEAVDYYQRALSLRRAQDDIAKIASTLEAVGRLYVALGQHADACAVWQEALELYREHGLDGDAARVQQQIDELEGGSGARK